MNTSVARCIYENWMPALRDGDTVVRIIPPEPYLSGLRALRSAIDELNGGGCKCERCSSTSLNGVVE